LWNELSVLHGKSSGRRVYRRRGFFYPFGCGYAALRETLGDPLGLTSLKGSFGRAENYAFGMGNQVAGASMCANWRAISRGRNYLHDVVP
jgi:hypothetical protein